MVGNMDLHTKLLKIIREFEIMRNDFRGFQTNMQHIASTEGSIIEKAKIFRQNKSQEGGGNTNDILNPAHHSDSIILAEEIVKYLDQLIPWLTQNLQARTNEQLNELFSEQSNSSILKIITDLEIKINQINRNVGNELDQEVSAFVKLKEEISVKSHINTLLSKLNTIKKVGRSPDEIIFETYKELLLQYGESLIGKGLSYEKTMGEIRKLEAFNTLMINIYLRKLKAGDESIKKLQLIFRDIIPREYSSENEFENVIKTIISPENDYETLGTKKTKSGSTPQNIEDIKEEIVTEINSIIIIFPESKDFINKYGQLYNSYTKTIDKENENDKENEKLLGYQCIYWINNQIMNFIKMPREGRPITKDYFECLEALFSYLINPKLRPTNELEAIKQFTSKFNIKTTTVKKENVKKKRSFSIKRINFPWARGNKNDEFAGTPYRNTKAEPIKSSNVSKNPTSDDLFKDRDMSDESKPKNPDIDPTQANKEALNLGQYKVKTKKAQSQDNDPSANFETVNGWSNSKKTEKDPP